MAERKPNIVLITVDCLRYDYLTKELTAQNSRVPFLQKLANRGIIFKNFYANGSWSGTAMPSILTSTYPFDNGGECKLSGREPTLPQLLKRGGYLTFGINANTYFLAQFGYDLGFDYFYDWYTSSNEEIYKIKGGVKDMLRKLPTKNAFLRRLHKIFNKTIRPIFELIYPTSNLPYLKAKDMNKIAFSCLNYYRTELEEKPFFLWLHYMDPHEPLLPDKTHLREKIDSRAIKDLNAKLVKHIGIGLTDQEAEMLRELYLAALSQADVGIKALYDFVTDRLGLKNTIFIVTTDHGDLLGEKKNYYSHGVWLYQELIHIPLLIAGAGIQHHQSSDLFSQIDLAPSILKVAGVAPPPNWRGKEILDGRLRIVDSDGNVVFAEEGRIGRDDHVTTTKSGIQFKIDWKKRSFAVVRERYKYIKNFYLNTEEFYNLSKDPTEAENLISSKRLEKEIASLRNKLDEHVKSITEHG